MADDIRGRVEDDICSVRTIEDVRAMKRRIREGLEVRVRVQVRRAALRGGRRGVEIVEGDD